MIIELEKLLKSAIKAALAAGKVIQEATSKDISVTIKQENTSLASQVVTLIDKKCDTLIRRHLRASCNTFDIGFLSEETEDDKSRFKKKYFWCVDPLDGTLAFINKIPGYAVSIALVAKDGSPLIGVVYDPSKNNLYHAIKSNGAFKNGKPWQPKPANSYLSYVTDKTLAQTTNKEVINKILSTTANSLNVSNIKEISGSGSVLNAILVAENAPALLFKLPKKENGGGSVWDFAATVCICQELNIQVTNFYGEKLDLNPRDTLFMNRKGVVYKNV